MDSQQSQPKPSNQMPKATAWAVIIVIILVLGVGGYFLFIKNIGTNTNNSNTTINQNTNVTANSNTALNTNASVNTNTVANANTAMNTNTSTNTNTVDTTSWKTYSNAKYGFSFKYPKEWYSKEFTNIDQRSNLDAVFGNNEITSLFDTDTVFTAAVETLKLTYGFTAADISAEFEVEITSSETKTIDGYDAIKLGNDDYYGLIVLINPATKQVLHFTPNNSTISRDLNAIYDSLTITK